MIIDSDFRRELSEAIELHREIQHAQEKLDRCKDRIRNFASVTHPTALVEGWSVEFKCGEHVVTVIFPQPKFGLAKGVTPAKVLEFAGDRIFHDLFIHKPVLRDDAEEQFESMGADARRKLSDLLGRTVQSPRVVLPK